jgi:hypothetical protein
MGYKKRRLIAVLVTVFVALSLQIYQDYKNNHSVKQANIASTQTGETLGAKSGLALEALNTLEVKGRAPKTGYARAQFGDGWQQVGTCNTRDHILARDMTNVVYKSSTDCDVTSGTLNDPYTGKVITFVRGATTSDLVQIDHVVALSDAWQTGAQNLSVKDRILIANDGLNLLAVDGKTNQDKSDADAASWLPPNKAYRCQYVARQVAVKQKYHLWVTGAEKDAIKNVLSTCPDQHLIGLST